MVKNMTKRLFGVIVLMMLMMATSLSAHADFYLIGSFNEWNQDTKLAMTQDADGYWTITKEFAANEEFKFIDGGTWVGAQSNNEITADVLNKGTAIKLSPDGGALNLKVMVAGTYTIVFDATGSTNGENYNMRMGVKAPVSVMANIANGQVTVNKEAAIPGETVRITVKPSGGYYIERNNITVEKTIGGGQAQNPGPKEEGPGVGSFVDVEGNPMNSVDLVNEYRFAMPESPYGAKVSAEFQACTAITSVDAIDDQTYTGSAIEPAVVVKAGETTLGEGDYTVEYSNNTAVGQATVIVTGKGKYTGTLTVNFNIVKAKHNITIATGIENGSVTPSVTEAVEGDPVTLTVAPAAGYEVGEVYYMNGEEKVVIENNSFVMPDFDVEINATFTAIDYTITIDDKIVNGIVEADKATANVGEKVTLTATPDVDYEFVSFTVKAGETTIAVENNQFTMPADNVTVSATFNALPVTYVIKWGIGSNWETVNDIALTKGDDKKWSTAAGTELDANAQFKVVRVVEGSGPEWYGKDFTVTTLPATIENLTNADNTPNIKFSKAGTYSFSYDPATKTLVVSGEFAPEKYAITVAEGITGGSVVPDKTEAAEGEKVTLTITPATGYELETLTVMMGETPVTVAEDNTFTMPAGNVVVSATFKKTLVTSQLTWTVTPAEGGTVVVKAGETTLEASPAEVLQTTVVTVTATPNENYELDAITVMSGETEITLGEGNTFEMPAADVAITVTFKAVEYDLEGVMFTAERQWATYYNGTKNLALPEGVKAYVVNSVVNDAVDITEINYIPAGVGVLLYSENAAEQVFTTIYTGETATYTSKLVGSDEAQEIAASAGYILYNNVFTLSEGGAVAAHRCYLPVNVTTNAPRVLRIGYDGSVTAIETLIATGNVASVKYVNLSGVTSSMPFRGINIAVITFTDGTTRTVKVIK